MAYGETIEKGTIIPNVEKGSYGSIKYNELGMNPRYKMVYWNMSIHFWLKYNVYIRVLSSNGPFRNNRVIASFITFIFSAIWHGFYPSYYVSFVLIYLFE
jgi:lysophospholipid acyltransferase